MEKELIIQTDKRDDLGDFLDYICEHGLGECIVNCIVPDFLPTDDGKKLFIDAQIAIENFREYINKVAEANNYDWEEEDFID